MTDTIATSTTIIQLIGGAAAVLPGTGAVGAGKRRLKVDTGIKVSAELPAAEVKAGVNDFEAAWAFLESGVEQLGDAA